MRMKKEEIDRLARLIVANLKDRKVAAFKAPEERLVSRVVSVFTKNLEEETAIEEEVRKLMDRYRAQIGSGEIDPQKVYQMIKRQVAKERKFIL